ncbi:MAG: CPBP family intramembrane glutamic endopeptidase [Dehalococcoidia bacterium]
MKLVRFFAISHGVTWSFFIAAALVGGVDTAAGTVLFALSGLGLLLAGPALAPLTLSRAERREYRQSIIDVRRIRFPWHLAVFLIPPALVIAGSALAWAVTGDAAELTELLGSAGFTPFGFLLAIVVAPLLEEMAWRGYALVELQKRHSALTSSLILGFMWAIFHIPLFFIPGTYQHGLGLLTLPFWQFMAAAVIGSVIITWIFNNTSYSTLSAFLYHAMVNLSGELSKTSVLSDVFYAVVLLGLALFLVLRFGGRTLTGRTT